MTSLANLLEVEGNRILGAATAFHDRAMDTLDLIEARGKEPCMPAGWLDEFTDPEPVYHFSLDSLIEPLPRTPRQPAERQRQAVVNEVQQAISASEAAAAVGTAHAESPSDWGRRITAAMEGCDRKSFWSLVEATGLSPGAVWQGLLLGGWRLEQQEFYGEVEVSRPKGK